MTTSERMAHYTILWHQKTAFKEFKDVLKQLLQNNDQDALYTHIDSWWPENLGWLESDYPDKPIELEDLSSTPYPAKESISNGIHFDHWVVPAISTSDIIDKLLYNTRYVVN